MTLQTKRAELVEHMLRRASPPMNKVQANIRITELLDMGFTLFQIAVMIRLLMPDPTHKWVVPDPDTH